MPKRTETFEIEYTYFEPGTLVTPTVYGTTLEYGQVYTVVECFPPRRCGWRIREGMCTLDDVVGGSFKLDVYTRFLREADA